MIAGHDPETARVGRAHQRRKCRPEQRATSERHPLPDRVPAHQPQRSRSGTAAGAASITPPPRHARIASRRVGRAFCMRPHRRRATPATPAGICRSDTSSATRTSKPRRPRMRVIAISVGRVFGSRRSSRAQAATTGWRGRAACRPPPPASSDDRWASTRRRWPTGSAPAGCRATAPAPGRGDRNAPGNAARPGSRSRFARVWSGCGARCGLPPRPTRSRIGLETADPDAKLRRQGAGRPSTAGADQQQAGRGGQSQRLGEAHRLDFAAGELVAFAPQRVGGREPVRRP